MKIQMTLEIAPFPTPEWVIVIQRTAKRNEGLAGQRIPLNELDEHVVEELCDNFKTSIMAARREYNEKCVSETTPR